MLQPGRMADDLRRWLGGVRIKARPISTLVQATRWCRRRPAVASLVFALTTTVSLSFAVLLGLFNRAETLRLRAEAARRVARRI